MRKKQRRKLSRISIKTINIINTGQYKSEEAVKEEEKAEKEIIKNFH